VRHCGPAPRQASRNSARNHTGRKHTPCRGLLPLPDPTICVRNAARHVPAAPDRLPRQVRTCVLHDNWDPHVESKQEAAGRRAGFAGMLTQLRVAPGPAAGHQIAFPGPGAVTEHEGALLPAVRPQLDAVARSTIVVASSYCERPDPCPRIASGAARPGAAINGDGVQRQRQRGHRRHWLAENCRVTRITLARLPRFPKTTR
jgi:hypothetical protein